MTERDDEVSAGAAGIERFLIRHPGPRTGRTGYAAGGGRRRAPAARVRQTGEELEGTDEVVRLRWSGKGPEKVPWLMSTVCTRLLPTWPGI